MPEQAKNGLLPFCYPTRLHRVQQRRSSRRLTRKNLDKTALCETARYRTKQRPPMSAISAARADRAKRRRRTAPAPCRASRPPPVAVASAADRAIGPAIAPAPVAFVAFVAFLLSAEP